MNRGRIERRTERGERKIIAGWLAAVKRGREIDERAGV